VSVTDRQLDELARALIPNLEQVADANPLKPRSGEYRVRTIRRRLVVLQEDLDELRRQRRAIEQEAIAIVEDQTLLRKELSDLLRHYS
jgi:hypothetical protein